MQGNLRPQAIILRITDRFRQHFRLAAMAQDFNIEGSSREGVFRRNKDKGETLINRVTI